VKDGKSYVLDFTVPSCRAQMKKFQIQIASGLLCTEVCISKITPIANPTTTGAGQLCTYLIQKLKGEFFWKFQEQVVDL